MECLLAKKIVNGLESDINVSADGPMAFYITLSPNTQNFPVSLVFKDDDKTTIYDCQFYKCSTIKTIEIPEGVTTLNDCCFAYLMNSTITLPSTITTINGDILEASSDTILIIKATTPPTAQSANFLGNVGDNIISIKVPSSSVNTYKAAARWCDFANIIQAIS